MSEYHPDTWVIVRMTLGEETVDKVMGGWYGGYTQGDSWRLNSGITEINDLGFEWEFVGHTGSTYICDKQSERMSAYMGMVFQSLKAQAEVIGGSMEVIPVEQCGVPVVA